MKKINNIPEHIAIILDGNGRWAKKRGLARSIGHYQGAMNLVKVANHANHLGVKEMSVYAFSTENWNRPEDEVNYLMTKPIELIEKNMDKFENGSIKILIKGRKDRVPSKLKETFEALEKSTTNHIGMILNVCFDYGSYDEIVRAVKMSETLDYEEITKNLMISNPVDLLIRTGGEIRLSNFMLWQLAYAELYFTKKYWPDFSKRDLEKSFKEFAKRNRRFGGIK